MAAMTPWGFCKALTEAGVLTEAEAASASRIVIDCKHDEAVQVYVQRFGDAEALTKLAPMLKGMFDSE